MATETILKELMTSHGITADDIASIDLGSAEEASERSLHAFASARFDYGSSARESMGVLHFTGPGIEGNSVPIDAIGNTLSSIQNVMNAIGASIKGFSSLKGQIPLSITERTSLVMDASPSPGSVIIRIRPKMHRIDDLYPDATPMLDIGEEFKTKPLADECFETFIEIMSSTVEHSPEHEKLIGLLTDLGPRASSSVKSFCETLSKDGLDLDVRWQEPARKPLKGELKNERAKTMSEFIKNAEIESEDVEIHGTLITSTLSPKDKLRILEDNDREVTVSLGKISKGEIALVRPGEKVTVRADCKIGKYAGGRTSKTYTGISLINDAQLPLGIQ